MRSYRSGPLTKYFSVIKSRRTKWEGYVSRIARGKVYIGLWWETLMERDNLRGSDIDGSFILRWIFRWRDVEAWT
jgi:hypothetical protein